MPSLSRLNRWLLGGIATCAGVLALKTYWPDNVRVEVRHARPAASPAEAQASEGEDKVVKPARPLRVALSQWPGHLALIAGLGGTSTQPGSIAAEEGLNLEVVFIEDAASKNQALKRGDVDFIWQTVDELPITLGQVVSAPVWAKAFLQIDWSRGGDACVASEGVQRVEQLLGKRSAMLRFSPDHTVFEFMINNSRLTPADVASVRAAAVFSDTDYAFARELFASGQVDVACLWEPDVTLALRSRPGAHRLFSTADATELVADVLLARTEFLDQNLEIAKKLARVWFRSVAQAEEDRRGTARLLTETCSRFRDELGESATLASLTWSKWTTLSDNVRFFGVDGNSPTFDTVYQQADSIWVAYPEAQLQSRFPPGLLRDERVVRALWEDSGKPEPVAPQDYDPEVAAQGSPVLVKPIALPFAANSSTLSPAAIAMLNREVVPQLHMLRGLSIRVEGNTDATGTEGLNRWLSEQRANAVRDYLIDRGVPRSRVQARGNGSRKPAASNASREGRALNRRTDVLFIRAS